MKETTGRAFDPEDVEAIAAALASLAGMSSDDRAAMGREAERNASAWGPERFASGMISAVAKAGLGPVRLRRNVVEEVR